AWLPPGRRHRAVIGARQPRPPPARAPPDGSVEEPDPSPESRRAGGSHEVVEVGRKPSPAAPPATGSIVRRLAPFQARTPLRITFSRSPPVSEHHQEHVRMASLKLGINGFGRIGRNIYRAAWPLKPTFDTVAVNDIGDAKTFAHLLKHDPALGTFE